MKLGTKEKRNARTYDDAPPGQLGNLHQGMKFVISALEEARGWKTSEPSLKELSSAICDFVFSSLGQFSRSVIILLLAAGVMVGPHGNNEIPGSPS